MENTRKVVINRCFGGFGLSPQALLRMYELGCTGIAVPADSYFSDQESYEQELKRWKEIKNLDPSERDSFFHVFTPDEKHVLIDYRVERDDPILVSVVEEMGEGSNGFCAELRIVEIPSDVDWFIHEYDGSESIHESHRSWS